MALYCLTGYDHGQLNRDIVHKRGNVAAKRRAFAVWTSKEML